MEALKEFVNRNPDIRTKVKIVAAVFFIFSFAVTRALLWSLALTILYTVLYTLILWVIREKKLLLGVHNGNEDQMPLDDCDEDDVIPEPSQADKFGGSMLHNNLTHRKPVSVFSQSQKENSDTVFESNFKQAKRPEQYFYQSSPQELLGIGNKRNIDTPRPFPPNRQIAYENMYGSTVSTPSFEMYQKQYIPGKINKLQIGQDKDIASPKTSNLLGVNRWGLSRQPLHQTDLNTPPTGGSQHYWEKGKTTEPMFLPPKVGYSLRPSSRMSAVNMPSPAGPQTSSPFHDSSQVGLWDTMSLSAIGGSPAHYISPITSPTNVGDKINSPSEHILVGSPSLSKGSGIGRKHHPVHTSGRPVELTRHSQPTSSLSSQWQKWNKGQTAVKVGGRPKLQSPVTIKIAHPDRFQMLNSRYNRTITGNAEETPESLRKDVILSALREKRKRGKVEQNQSLNQEGNSSLEETQPGSRLKKRRLNAGNESQELLDEPAAKSSHSGRTHRRKVKSGGVAKDTHLSRPAPSLNSTEDPDSLNESVKSCRRNAIESSLSSSRMWRENRLKRGLQPEEKETIPVGPPKKVSRATDVSGLVSDGKKIPERKEDSASAERSDVSSEEEKSQGEERTKPSIPQRLRKRAVFTTIHRGKKAKPPSPNQVTAADLNEDRQRARERIQQMRELLRDETAPPRETPKNADKPLLPAEKPPSSMLQSSAPPSTSISLTSTFSVSKPSTTMNQTELDGSNKSSKGKGGLLDQLLKEDPITKKLAEDAKKNATPPKSSLSSASGGLGLFNTTPGATSALSVSVSNQPSSSSPSKPTSLLQALSSMRQTTQADQAVAFTTLSMAGGLGFKIGQSNQVNTTVSAAPPSATTKTTSSLLVSSAGVGSMLGTFTAAPTVPATTTMSPPTFNFGSNSLSGTSSGQTQPTASVQQQQQQPSFQFGSPAPSTSTQINFNAPGKQPEAAPAQSLFSFGASTNPLLSGTQSQVSSSSQPLTSAPTSSSNVFTFGNAAVSKQSTAGSNTLSFGTTNTASAQPSQNKVTFGGTSAPTFNFGSAKTDQTSGSTPSFTFGGGTPAPLTSQSSSAPSPAQFSFGAKSSSTAPSLFQQTPSQASAVASTTTVTPSLFAFGGAASKPGSISSSAVSSATAVPSFSFGSQSAPSSTFAFGSQQSKPASQSSLFAPSQPLQPAGLTFGSQSATPAPLFPSAAATTATPQQQQPQQSGFSFGNQPAQSGGLFQSSTSTPSLNFGAPNQTAPSASGFQFGGSTSGAQQQLGPSFNFSATPSAPSSFNFGAASSTPQFGQGQVTPVKPAGGFSMGTTTAPRKTASARMRQKARAGRR